MTSSHVLRAGLAVLAFAATAHLSAKAGFDGDLVPRLSGSQIVTDGISDEDGSTATNLRTYQYTLGELSPGYTEDPGFQPQTTSGLPGGSFLGFNTVGALLYWNGVGVPNFVPVTSGAQLEFYLGPSTHYVGGSSGAADGFVIQELTASGSGHRHLNAQLLGVPSSTGSYIDSLGITYDAPLDGIYAVAIETTDSVAEITDPADLSSAPDYLVYDQNLSDATLSAGADALNATLVPEPGSLMVVGIGSALLICRGRRVF
jgi:hypothetical protein